LLKLKSTMDIIEEQASNLEILSRSYRKTRSQLCEVIVSGEKTLVSELSPVDIKTSLEGTEWWRTVKAESSAEVHTSLWQLIDMICAIPRDEREPAIRRALKVLYKGQR
jgi:hypothetical protein